VRKQALKLQKMQKKLRPELLCSSMKLPLQPPQLLLLPPMPKKQLIKPKKIKLINQSCCTRLKETSMKEKDKLHGQIQMLQRSKA
jgi:hypothetical protein